MVNAQEIPVSSANLDELQVESPLKYEQVCKIVGELFIDSHRRVSVVEDHARSLLSRLSTELEGAKEENRELKRQIEEHSTSNPKEEKSGL